MSAWDFFDAIYCINLDHREDRWAKVQEQFKSVGIADRVERFSAIEPKKQSFPFYRIGEEGCLLSHWRVMKKASAAGHQNFLVFEDDIEFFNVDVEAALSAAIGDLPLAWQLLYLGASEWKGKRYKFADSLNILDGAASSHSVCLNLTYFHYFNDLFRKACHKGFAVDKIWECIVQPRRKCFETSPMLTYHTEGYSDILNRTYKAY